MFASRSRLAGARRATPVRYDDGRADRAGLASETLRVAYLFVPLLGGGVLLALASRHNWLPSLARPIDNGWTLRGRRLFGDHKTLRGVLAGGVGTAAGVAVQAHLLHHLPRSEEHT